MDEFHAVRKKAQRNTTRIPLDTTGYPDTTRLQVAAHAPGACGSMIGSGRLGNKHEHSHGNCRELPFCPSSASPAVAVVGAAA